ncbi:hypothetical protein BIFCAT_01944 [Bifidobacterium catenulatum DSM 16992 = JCM 1194 = LMG 11043]|uniref:Uncharacterized protein n=1 Tax=Bifidobacterium catenulatum DSM 16992 = JCM 1194 = LMG 11043 TaxID=566552 RepID=B6XXI3_9BIFI|nr:hypothetical protein BIFCAT_01944 [Bifidobacterium catenulatum DSM 16992 = JCM 1194 = LMG 11043]
MAKSQTPSRSSPRWKRREPHPAAWINVNDRTNGVSVGGHPQRVLVGGVAALPR